MSSESSASSRTQDGESLRRLRLANALPWLWLGMSAAWALVIFVTDQVAWPLALWIATTVGPLTALTARVDPTPRSRRSIR